MLYSIETTGTTAAASRVVDCHSLLHLQASKPVKACDAADAVDGLVLLSHPTIRVAAVAWGLNFGLAARAHCFAPEQRQEGRCGMRPLVLPRTSAALLVPAIVPAAVPPVMMGVEKLRAAVVEKIGVSGVLEFLAANEKVAACASAFLTADNPKHLILICSSAPPCCATRQQSATTPTAVSASCS